MDLLTILEKTMSPDKNELEAVQRYLEQAAQNNLPELLKQLSDVLKHGGHSPAVRIQAGLQLKNALYSKDLVVQEQYKTRWLQFPEDVTDYVKQNVLATLGTESRPSTAAQCVAYIACTELPVGRWTDLVTKLTQNVTDAQSGEIMREASLEAIGYICQDIDPDILTSRSNEILTAIVHGMKKEESSDHVKSAATIALLNSLEFTKANFDITVERHFIMQVVCEATQSTHSHVSVAALQCLVKIMSLYYQYMEHYMGPALFAITIAAMESPIDEVALQGIEFWSNVCDEEVDLAIEFSEAQERGQPPERTSRFYAKGALAYLIPILTRTLAKQEELDDDDDWNPCKAAGVCLMLMASCCEDDVVPHVLPFINKHIESSEWRFRDAAVMAFGSILEGPGADKLVPILSQAMTTLISLLKDPSVVVRDTTAWTVGRICETLPEAIVNDTYLDPLLCALVEGLSAEPRVAANVCWAFSSLAEAAYEAVEPANDQIEPKTYSLSKYFDAIIQELLATTDRLDGNQHNLRSAAYEALMELVKNSPEDCYFTVQKTTLVILERLQHVIDMESRIQSTSDRVQYNDLQSLLCATLQSVLRKVLPDDAPKISDSIMAALLQMLQHGSKGGAGGVQEDALLAVSTLVEVLGENFIMYMEAFKPFLAIGLTRHEEYQVCLAAIGLTGDICRSLGAKVLPYCNEIMMMLLENLGNTEVHRSVKPQILSVFGDIALAIGPAFQSYLEVVLTTLEHASMAEVDRNDFDMIDYLNELREGCLEAYTGIIQGMKGENGQINPDVHLVRAVPHMLELVAKVALDEEHSDAVIGACCGLIGDLVTAYGKEIVQGVDKEPVVNLLTKGRRSKTGKTKTLATWATREIRKVKNAASSWCVPARLIRSSSSRRPSHARPPAP